MNVTEEIKQAYLPTDDQQPSMFTVSQNNFNIYKNQSLASEFDNTARLPNTLAKKRASKTQAGPRVKKKDTSRDRDQTPKGKFVQDHYRGRSHATNPQVITMADLVSDHDQKSQIQKKEWL